MKHRAIATFGLSALLLGGTVVGCAGQQHGIAPASALNNGHFAGGANRDAAAARKAMSKGKLARAMSHAEAAVAAMPQEATYRALLGQVYLQIGRFESAHTALADALMLAPGDGKIALNFALAQIASGDWAGARKTLDEHASAIPVGDYGLAVALAGDPVSAVELLSAAARSPNADAKTRQNLALSLALAGRWQEAKVVASIDVAPDEIDQRIVEWASFARPKGAADQVAALLGVTPVEDPGQPVALALNVRATPTAVVDAAVPGRLVEVAQAAPVAEAPPVQVPVAVAKAEAGVRFAAPSEVVQQLPARQMPAASKAKFVPAVAAHAGKARVLAKGKFYVQLGAYDNASVAHDGWLRATRRYASFAVHTPSGMKVQQGSNSFYRLSVGGFARPDAVAMCAGFRRTGGACFVREGAGDQLASWVQPPHQQLASR